MFIEGSDTLLRAVEEETFTQALKLIKGTMWIGPVSRLICDTDITTLGELLRVAGSRELSPGRMMAVSGQEPEEHFYGVLLIEQADWKNGILHISVYPEPRKEGCQVMMSDGLQALMQFGFDEMRMESAVVSCTGDDEAVGAICRMAGMSHDLCLRSRLSYKGQRLDVTVYTRNRLPAATDELQGGQTIETTKEKHI